MKITELLIREDYKNFFYNTCLFSLQTCHLYLLGKLFLAGKKFQQKKYIRRMEAMRLPKGFCTILNYPENF